MELLVIAVSVIITSAVLGTLVFVVLLNAGIFPTPQADELAFKFYWRNWVKETVTELTAATAANTVLSAQSSATDYAIWRYGSVPTYNFLASARGSIGNATLSADVLVGNSYSGLTGRTATTEELSLVPQGNA